VLEGVSSGGNEGEGRKESAELRPQEPKQEKVESTPTEPTIEEIKKDYIQLGFNEELANKNANHLHRALNDEKFAYELLDISNKNSRKIWSKITGLTLPNTQKGSRRVIENYFINKRNPNLANAAKLIAKKYGSLENIANTDPNEIYESIPEVDYETAESIVNGARDALIENGQESKLKSKAKSEPTSTEQASTSTESEKVGKALNINGVKAITPEGKVAPDFREKIKKAIDENDLDELNSLYTSTKIILNGTAQRYGESTVSEFEQIKNELENEALRRKEAKAAVESSPTVEDFAALEAKGVQGRKLRDELAKRIGKDKLAEMRTITTKFESIITALEDQGKITKKCP